MSSIRADLAGVVVIPTDGGNPIILAAGDPVPQGVTLGGHLLEPKTPAKPAK